MLMVSSRLFTGFAVRQKLEERRDGVAERMGMARIEAEELVFGKEFGSSVI